jgi:predicted lipoprotein
MRRVATAGTLAILVSAATGGCRGVATVRPLDEKGEPAAGAAPQTLAFDAAAFVDSIWRSELLRAVEQAREIGAIARDGARASSPSGTKPVPLVVWGRGRVLAVDTRSRSGTATIELEGQVRATAVVQVGPVLTGTAIRDALPALGFDRFVNQIQHADVGNELNARVEREVLQQLDRAGLRGRHVRFAGMASVEEGRPLTVTPVRLEVETTP